MTSQIFVIVFWLLRGVYITGTAHPRRLRIFNLEVTDTFSDIGG